MILNKRPAVVKPAGLSSYKNFILYCLFLLSTLSPFGLRLPKITFEQASQKPYNTVFASCAWPEIFLRHPARFNVYGFQLTDFFPNLAPR
jgi:hypothetical protein